MEVSGWRFFFIFCAWITSTQAKRLKVFNNVTDAEYNSMPPLFHLDDYDKCLLKTNESLYCYATIQLSPLDPDNPSEIWSIIKEVISLERNYRHDRLRHGICVQESCPEAAAADFATGNGSEALWRGVSQCYSRKYRPLGLAGHVTQMHCETSAPYYTVDTLDRIYAGFVGVLVLFVLVGTTYDILTRLMQPEGETATPQETLHGRILMAFSIPRNLERLRSDVTSDDGKALLPIQGVRVFNMIFVVMTHTIMVEFLGPIHNTQYAENATLRVANMFLANGSLICQTFLIISGWLLSYNLCLIFDGKKIKLYHLFLAFVNRYLRLLPILLLGIGFSATWLRHLGRGPIWNLVVGQEFENCRKNGWTNFAFLNNYIDPGHMCLQQTWYMASDSQLFTLGLFIMYFIINNPKFAKKTFAFFILLGIAITFAENYYYDYDIVFRGYPETFYTMYLESEHWLRIFAPGHHQMSCYVQGLACGYYFYEYRKHNREFLQTKFTTAVWFVFVWTLPMVTVLIAAVFYQEGFETTRFWAAAYMGIARYSFGLPISIGLFALTLGKGGVMRDFVCWGPLQVLGRLSFSVYLTHVGSMRLKRGPARMPSYVTDHGFFVGAVGDITVSYFIGLVVCLLVEMPTSALQKILLTPNKQLDKADKQN